MTRASLQQQAALVDVVCKGATKVMAFCGQCGLLLAPGNETCPRCGSVTEPELVLDNAMGAPQTDDPRADSPTITSLANPDAQRSAGPGTPQQQLVLRPDGSQASFDELAYAQNDPTRIMTSPPSMPQISHVRTPYHGFTPPVDIYNQPMPQQYSGANGDMLAQPRQRRRGGGRVLALLVILFVLLIALGAAVVQVIKPALLRGIIGNNVISSETATTTPTIQARGVIRRYYDDINSHNYHDAYTLWVVDPQHPPGSYESFANGFAHTLQDDIVFNSVTPLANGTVQVDVTLTATEEGASGNVQHVYHLFYLVGQQGGTWKILNGHSL